MKLIRGDTISKIISFIALIVGVSFLLLMLMFFFKESSIGFNFNPNLKKFLFQEGWSPLSSPPSFGIRHAIISTVFVSGLSLLLAIPIGIGIGLFLSEIAPKKVQILIQPALELLAGIPAVVYGFFGYAVFVKNFEIWFNMPTGECVLVAGIVLSMMVLPFIASTSAEAFRNVPWEYREAAYSLGVNRSYVIMKILFRKALPGLFAAVALGIARALGETLAVLMLAGNSTEIPKSLLDRAQPITALLATELGETSIGSEKYHALYSAGLLLMLVVLIINISIWLVKKRMKRLTYA
ncbi:MAG: phosphate ABC transporter permease subunit PstC [Syntrophorhabdaceae bacterium]|nr:phosphate ABC transporter permease subunit PstC [Syntrophorhabdaceae bacterium]